MKAMVKAHFDANTGFTRCLEDWPQFLGLPCGRLLDEDMLSLPKRGKRQRGQSVIDGGDDDQIDIGPGDAGLPVRLDLAARILGGQPLRPLRTRKGEWLLALLTLRHDRPVERPWLAGTLWPGSATKQGTDSLRRALTDLRQAMGPEAARLRAPTPHTLCLSLVEAEVDLIAFDQVKELRRYIPLLYRRSSFACNEL